MPHSAALDISRAIGSIGLGLGAGLSLGLGLVALPPLFTVQTLSPRDRLHLWSQSGSIGSHLLAPLVAVPGLSLLVASALAEAPLPYFSNANFISLHRRSFLAIAGLSALAVVPFSLLTLHPRGVQLAKVEQEMIKTNEATSNVETDVLIEEWLGLHLIRTWVVVGAFVVSVVELVASS